MQKLQALCVPAAGPDEYHSSGRSELYLHYTAVCIGAHAIIKWDIESLDLFMLQGRHVTQSHF